MTLSNTAHRAGISGSSGKQFCELYATDTQSDKSRKKKTLRGYVCGQRSRDGEDMGETCSSSGFALVVLLVLQEGPLGSGGRAASQEVVQNHRT